MKGLYLQRASMPGEPVHGVFEPSFCMIAQGSKVVLLGESTHGTSEFYRMRARITRELIERKGFKFVAIEGDWPDAARVDHYVRHAEFPV